MKSRIYGIAAAGLATVFALSLTACGQSSSGGSAATTSDLTGNLNILVSSAPGSDTGFKAINDIFSQLYPNVKVQFTTDPNDQYNAAKSSQMTAGQADIVIASPKQLPSYVPASNEGDDSRLADAGGFVDLTDQPFMSHFTSSVLDQIKYNGKVYAVPTGITYYSGIMYNKQIFADNNLQVPTTWDEFVTLMGNMKTAGIQPLGIGGKDSAGLNMLGLVQSLYPTSADKTNLAQGLYAYTTKLNEGTQLEVMTKLKTLYDNAEPNFAGVSYAQMTSDFVNGKFAMMSDGTWNTATIAQAGGDGFQFGYFPLPASNNAADNANLGGKVELQLAIPSNAPDKANALAWLDTFSQPENYGVFLSTAGFAPSEPGVPAGTFYDDIAQYTTTFQPAWDTIWFPNQQAGQAAQWPFSWDAEAPMGTLDPQAAADAAESAWEAGK